MSSANVIPSAPELYPMNEITQINAEDVNGMPLEFEVEIN